MVSLFDLRAAPRATHIATGVPALDEMLALATVIDVQSVPACPASRLVISHLAASRKSLIVQTQNSVPWDAPRVAVRGFAQLLSFFTNLQKEPILVVVEGFHETLELYRLQLAAAYEELLLRHQIDKNDVLLQSMDRVLHEGAFSLPLPHLPPKSLLLKESPAQKFSAHVDHLFNVIADFAFESLLVVVLSGCMDLVYEDQGDASQEGHMVLAPHVYDKLNRVSARVLFYNDVFEDRPVFAAQVRNLDGSGNINEPVLFECVDGKLVSLGEEESDLSQFIQQSLLRLPSSPFPASQNQ